LMLFDKNKLNILAKTLESKKKLRLILYVNVLLSADSVEEN